ncbi:efflux RND transporter permease subunit [Lusitaniella coriacea]|uniref:efflux RND transporter permease subunit n=1 Tax=Lusitaniella coriacea TaxID=1983105 RepID=UPI003CF9C5B1
MSFHVSSWSIKKPVPTIVMFLILAIVGFFSFKTMGIDQQPNIDVPAVIITVTQPGAGPEELETQVTKKIEDAVAGLGNIDEIVSNVNDGNSTTTINFVLGTDSNEATNDVRNAVAQIRTSLPEDINEPIVKRLEFSGGSIMTYAVISEQRSVEELSDLVDRTIGRALLNVPGVAQIDRLGGVDREIRIDLDPSRLQAYGITATQVNDQIRRLNINLPGGRTEIGGSEQNVRTLGSAETVEDLGNSRIVLPNGDTVPLTSLGSVEDHFAEPRKAAFLNGKPIVAFSVLRSPGSTLVTVESGVRKAVEQLKKTLPEDVELDLTFTRAQSIRGTYNATINALLIGCVLTVITVGIFLREWRATLITGLALPLSIIPTFGVMKVLGYTLNGMTLLALALAIGNLVDDAICMIENIDQHLQMGKTPLQAAWDGAREIGLAVVATTATIVAVFLPVAFMGGIPGQFFQPFGVTVAVSTMFSTLVACTMTPMLSAYLLRPKENVNGNGSSAFSTSPHKKRPYQTALTWALRHRITTLLVAIAFFIGSLQLVPFIPKGLFDEGDTGISTVMVDLPPGSTLSETTDILKNLTQDLLENPAVNRVVARANSVDSGLAYVKLVPKDERIHQREFEKQMRGVFQKIPGARVAFRSSGPGGSAKDVSIVLKSDNPQVLTQTANAIETKMGEIPGLVDVTSSLSLVKPEIIIEPARDRASDLGVSVQSIARTASLALIGDNESSLAKFNLPDRQIPIRVQIAPEAGKDIETLQTLRVPSANGSLVPLKAVANLRLGSGPAEIKRFDRSRQVSLEANLEGISLGDAVAQIKSLPEMSPLPPEVEEEPAGDAKIMRDIFTRFGSALGFAVLSIYAILVLLYNNFLYPFAILSALPLSIGGALLGLLVTQKEMGLFALIGIVLLMGLVTKNAILLVDFALAAQQEGKPQFKAVVQAGVSRLRPILMTSISTIAGMMPIALEFGADGEVRSPMAIAVIGGFSTSTLLTLIVVPVLFTYVDSVVHWLGRLFRGKKSVRTLPLLQEEEIVTQNGDLN